MKKLTLALLFLLAVPFYKAQVPNYSFENLNTNGTIKNWGAIILLAIPLDTNGNPMDSLIMDNQFYFSTNNAHTGIHALEMRNAYWQNSGETIGGRAMVSANDTDYAAFSIPVPIGQNPVDFSFYYKFIPANGDTAYAWLQLTDNNANIVGEAKIFIHGAHSLFTLATTPVVYSSAAAAAFMEIGFSTSKPNSQISYGTRFVVDDVNLSMATTGISPLRLDDNKFSCFPNPAGKEINFRLKNPNSPGQLHLNVMDASGKKIQNLSYSLENDLIKINTEELAEGLYFLNVIQGSYSHTGRFIK